MFRSGGHVLVIAKPCCNMYRALRNRALLCVLLGGWQCTRCESKCIHAIWRFSSCRCCLSIMQSALLLMLARVLIFSDEGVHGPGSTVGAACVVSQLHEDMLHVSTPHPAAGRLERRALTKRAFSATTSRPT